MFFGRVMTDVVAVDDVLFLLACCTVVIENEQHT
jgi:hypothetical protein